MSKNLYKDCMSNKLLRTLCGGILIGLPAIPMAVLAQQQPQPRGLVNPCPKIFYDEPHNSQVFVPQGCPPNAYTKQHLSVQESSPTTPTSPTPAQTQQGVGGQTPDGGKPQSSNSSQSSSQSSVVNSTDQNSSSVQTQSSVIQTAPPQTAVASVIVPTTGRVNVRLVNQTNAPISYQAIGDTVPRTLQRKSDLLLQSLRIPLTITFHRQDGGFLMVTPQSSSQDKTLTLTLRETTDFRMDRSAMRIEQNGAVYLD